MSLCHSLLTATLLAVVLVGASAMPSSAAPGNQAARSGLHLDQPTGTLSFGAGTTVTCKTAPSGFSFASSCNTPGKVPDSFLKFCGGANPHTTPFHASFLSGGPVGLGQLTLAGDDPLVGYATAAGSGTVQFDLDTDGFTNHHHITVTGSGTTFTGTAWEPTITAGRVLSCASRESVTLTFTGAGLTGASNAPTFTVSPFGSGLYQFISTTPAPTDGSTVTDQWNFGDGATDSGPAVAHTYTTPGTYTVTLTVTSSNGDVTTATQQLTVTAPKLSVSVIFPVATFYSAPPNPDVDATLEVQIDVGASDGVGNLSNVEFLGAPLQISPAPKLSILDGPTPSPTASLSLSPNSDAIFDYHLKAEKLGVATLGSHVTASDAAGNALAASGQQAVQIGKNLVVDVTPTPTPVTVPLDSQGNPVPQAVTVTVTVTNPLTVTLPDVVLGKPPTVLRLQASETADPIALDPKTTLPTLDLGPMAPNQKIKTVFAYQAIHDGDAELDWPVSATNPDDPNDPLKGLGKGVVMVNPTILLTLDISKVTTGGAVKAGQPFDVHLQIKNVTNAAVVHLDPVKPVLAGNAGGGNPFDINNPPPPAQLNIAPGTTAPATECNPSPAATGSNAKLDDTYVIPWSGKVGPGDPLALWGVVQTVPDGPTRATMTYHLTGTVELKDGTTRPLTDQDVMMTPGDGVVDQPIDTTDPPPVKADFTSFAGNFGLGMIRGTCEFYDSTFDSVAWVVKSGFAVVNPRTYGVGALKLYQAIEYGITWYHSLTPAQQDAWVSEGAQIIWDQTTDKTTTTYAAIKKQLNSDALGFFTRLGHAWDTGDMNAVANTMGDLTANTGLQVLTFVMPSADVVSLAERSKGAEAAAQGIKDATKLEDGINLTKDFPEALPDIYGVAPQQVAGTSALAADKNVLIAIRSRHPISDSLVKLYNAVTKPGSISVKTVNEIDVAYLGYNATDTGLVALFKPDHAAVVAAAAKLDPDVQGLVLARLAQREKEWTDYIAKYQGYAQPLDRGGGIPVEFDWNGQGVSTQPNPGAGKLRGFDLSNLGPDGSPRPANYFLPRIADKSGVLRVITGDVDVVGIVEANGRAIISAAERIDIYKNLMQILDMQHPETLTWLTGGAKQLDLLKDHVGQFAERLAVFGPDGNAFTASINANLTTFDKNNALLGVWFNGAYKSSTAMAYHYADVGAAILQNTVGLVTSQYISATSWFLTTAGTAPAPAPTSVRANDSGALLAGLTVNNTQTEDGDNHGLLGACRWQFSVESSATVLYTDGKGGLLQWNAGSGRWTPYDASACTGSGTHPDINVRPQTALVWGVPAGATTADTYGLAAIDPDVSAASTPWIGIGDQVVIDPGQSVQETATVKSLAPLTFEQPLRFAHGPGAMLSEVSRGSGSRLVITILVILGLILLALFVALTVRARRRGASSWAAAASAAARSFTAAPRRMTPRRRQKPSG